MDISLNFRVVYFYGFYYFPRATEATRSPFIVPFPTLLRGQPKLRARRIYDNIGPAEDGRGWREKWRILFCDWSSERGQLRRRQISHDFPEIADVADGSLPESNRG